MKSLIVMFFLFSVFAYGQEVETESNDNFLTANIATTSGPFVGTTDADWQGDLWRLNLTAGSHTVSWTGDACTRFRIVEYITDPALPGFPFTTPGGVSTCPQILSSDQCHLVDNLPGLGSVSTSFTVVPGRFYYCFINPHNCTNEPYGSTGLPVELIHFSGESAEGNTLLKWSTASEINNDKFEIQYSTDGDNFLNAGEIKGVGASNVLNNYQFSWGEVFNGLVYFRLKQFDFDRRFQYSDVISIEINNSIDDEWIKINPNPNNGIFTLETTDVIGKIVVLNLMGEIQFEINDVHRLQEIDLSALANGGYLIQIEHEGKIMTSKFIKQ